MENFFPKYYSNNSLNTFIITLLCVSLLYNNNILPIDLLLFVLISGVLFFKMVYNLSFTWRNLIENQFKLNVVIYAFFIRLIFVTIVYFYNIEHWGLTYASAEDIEFYINMGKYGAECVGNLEIVKLFVDWNRWGVDTGDWGYPLHLSLVYLLTANISDVFIPFIVKSLLGAYTCLFIYNITKRHFGERIAKLAAVLCVVNPLMIWWCGSMMKEAEMIFYTICFVNNWDDLICNGSKTRANIILIIFLSFYLFTFRIALGIVALLSVVVTLFLYEKKVKNKGKIFIILSCILVVMIVGFFQQISEVVNQIYTEIVIGDNKAQEINMEWRSQRVGGNEFAKYAGAAIFAPLIFSIPFPTFVYIDLHQEFIVQVAGGNFVKNILSFFVIYSVFDLFLKKEWRKHILILSFTIGYLIMLVLSVYAQSGRFHMPVAPLQMIFAAYGIAVFPKNKRHWFNYALIFEFVVCIAWNWFKLKGRGMI